MVMANRFGKMAASMMASGKGIRLMASENSFMLMEIFMKANGLTTKLMGKAHIPTRMVRSITEIG